MPDSLKVRVYNVRFGDAVLVTVPDRDAVTGVVTQRNILIDFGNAPLVASPQGGDDSVFGKVLDDLLQQLAGRPLDLFVLSHEHLDHAQGLLYAARKLLPNGAFQNRFKVNHIWLTASAHPDYYDHHPKAKKKFDAAVEQYLLIETQLALSAAGASPAVKSMLANNNPQSTTACVEFIRALNPGQTHYIHRTADLKGMHGFREAEFTVWAPEEDTSAYYGNFQPFMVETPGQAPGATAADALVPPAGVDLGAFLNLVATRRDGMHDNLLTIDKAANNSSIVFLLEWRGWRLLFAGDAEVRSWQTMEREGVLAPVDFLKVAHHGSHNGTPLGTAFDAILPDAPNPTRPRRAAISTWRETYNGIPHEDTNNRLRSRAQLLTTLDDPDALFYEVEFEGA